MWFRVLSTLAGLPLRALDAVATRVETRRACRHAGCPRVWVLECPRVGDEGCLARVRSDAAFREWMVAHGWDDH